MIELAAKAMVDKPNSIKVEQIETEDGLKFRVWCAGGDIGKLIGVSGKTARSLRTLVVGAGKASRMRYLLDIAGNCHVENKNSSLSCEYEWPSNAV